MISKQSIEGVVWFLIAVCSKMLEEGNILREELLCKKKPGHDDFRNSQTTYILSNIVNPCDTHERCTKHLKILYQQKYCQFVLRRTQKWEIKEGETPKFLQAWKKMVRLLNFKHMLSFLKRMSDSKNRAVSPVGVTFKLRVLFPGLEIYCFPTWILKLLGTGVSLFCFFSSFLTGNLCNHYYIPVFNVTSYFSCIKVPFPWPTSWGLSCLLLWLQFFSWSHLEVCEIILQAGMNYLSVF